MTYEEACTVVTNYQFEHNINLWVNAFVRLSNFKKSTPEQQNACAIIQLEFDKQVK